MKLYGFFRSSAAFRVRIALNLKGLDYEIDPIVPFFGDQPFWAHCLNQRGVAPPALERKNLTADALAAALRATQQPAMIEAAAALGRSVRAENGIDEALRWLRMWDLLPAIATYAAGKRIRTTA